METKTKGVLGKRPRDDDDAWTRNIKPLLSTVLVGKAAVPVPISWPHARRNSKFLAAFEEDDLPKHVLPTWEGSPLENKDFKATWLAINGFSRPTIEDPYFLNYFDVATNVLVVLSFEGDLDGPYFHVFKNPKKEELELLLYWEAQNKQGFSSVDRSLGGPPANEEERKFDAMCVLLDDTDEKPRSNDISGMTFQHIIKFLIW